MKLSKNFILIACLQVGLVVLFLSVLCPGPISFFATAFTGIGLIILFGYLGVKWADHLK